MKNFTDLTKGELITRIIEQYDPEIGSDIEVLLTCNAEHPDDHPLEKVTLRIRDGKYYVAPMDWTYYNASHGALEWEEITREKFRAIIQESCEAEDINKLRSTYHSNRLLERKINTITSLRIQSSHYQRCYHRAQKRCNELEEARLPILDHYKDTKKRSKQLVKELDKLGKALKE